MAQGESRGGRTGGWEHNLACMERMVKSKDVIATQHDSHTLIQFQFGFNVLAVHCTLAIPRKELNNFVTLVLESTVLRERVVANKGDVRFSTHLVLGARGSASSGAFIEIVQCHTSC